MNSFFARNRLSAYLDHSLPRDEAEAVEAVARDIALSADLRAMKKALTPFQERIECPRPLDFKPERWPPLLSSPCQAAKWHGSSADFVASPD